MPPRTPTASAISRLLAAAGFERAVVTDNSRYRKENTEGFHVRKHPSGVIVTYWPASVLPTARTTDFVQAEQRRVRVMLERYAHVIDDAGWTAEVTALQTVTVTAPPSPPSVITAAEEE